MIDVTASPPLDAAHVRLQVLPKELAIIQRIVRDVERIFSNVFDVALAVDFLQLLFEVGRGRLRQEHKSNAADGLIALELILIGPEGEKGGKRGSFGIGRTLADKSLSFE